jgi:alpha-tubulin suppressor-like RCC1 family protein/lysophospholipase L1-like esterase
MVRTSSSSKPPIRTPRGSGRSIVRVFLHIFGRDQMLALLVALLAFASFAIEPGSGFVSGTASRSPALETVDPQLVSSSRSHLATAVAISAGNGHSCAVLGDGTARCWGANGYGELGDGTTTDRPTPVAVSGLSGAVAISAGAGHSCAVLGDGTARCWGGNYWGQLGDGTTTGSPTPVAVSGLSGAVAISAGDDHSCAVLANGTARCWGRNDVGQLGDGTTTDSPTPVVVSGLSGAVTISAGASHSCALLENGTARCWGDNYRGELGDGTTANRSTPVVVSGLSGAVTISAGVHHSCAVLGSGAARCWGANGDGELGDGTTTDRPTPVAVSGLSGAVAVSTGTWHSCAVLGDGTARCWGGNYWGQLGDGTTTGSRTPVAVSGLTGAVAISAGASHSCAVLGNGSARCWGHNYWGQLGDGTTANRSTPVAVVAGSGSEERPADTNGDGVVRVAILGDSYISGEGAADSSNPYDPATDSFVNGCHRTTSSWAWRTAMSLGASPDNVLFAACSGAVTGHILSTAQAPGSPPGVYGGNPQLQYLKEFQQKAPVDLVLVSIGGNDVDFAGTVGKCVLLADCWFTDWLRDDQPGLSPKRDQLEKRLIYTYRRIAAAAPSAQVWAVDYIDGIDRNRTSCAGMRGISGREAGRLEDWFLAPLNRTIFAAATQAEIRMLSMAPLGGDGHEICSGQDYVKGIRPGFGWNACSFTAERCVVASESFHPNAQGHQAMADRFLSKTAADLGNEASYRPSTTTEAPPPTQPRLRVVSDSMGQLLPGQDARVVVQGAPNTTYRLVVRSAPQEVATLRTDASGAAEVVMAVPWWAYPGLHVVSLEAPDGAAAAISSFVVPPSTACPAGPGDVDADGDELADRCDGDRTDGPTGDVDGDGMANAVDNCPTVPNADQASTAGYDSGDACNVELGNPASAGYRPAEFTPNPGPVLQPVSPARVWDSRSGPGPVGRIGPGQRRDITVVGVGGVPSDGVTAVWPT